MKKAFQYVDDHFEQMVTELQALCAQPSIAAQNIGMEETAAMLVKKMKDAGIDARVLENEKGYPVVYGEVKGSTDKTLLFYNHYDVQPPDPVDKWKYPPFGSEIHDGILYARGCSDNKGTLLSRIHAVESILKTGRTLPVNVKFLIEGEEEIGSPSFEAFVHSHKDLLKADACLWENSAKDEDNNPVVKLGNKGMLYCQLHLKTGNTDVHSMNAPIVPNAGWRLIQALRTLKDDNDHILIDGFYDDVLPISPEETEAWKKVPSPEAGLKKRLGIDKFVNDATGDQVNLALYTKPSCNICGVVAGYTGEGQKTVTPCEASAKLDFRLVVAQDPDKIFKLLRKHLDSHGFQDIEVSVTSAAAPAKTPVTEKFVQVIQRAAQDVYEQPLVILPTAAGTGPRDVFAYSGMPIAGIGCGHAGSVQHAPNENIKLVDYKEAIKHVAALLFHAEKEDIR